MPDFSRQITIRLGGYASLPVHILVEALEGLQESLFLIGDTKTRRDPDKATSRSSSVEEECALDLVHIEMRSPLQATLQLRSLEKALLPDADIGLSSVGDLRTVIDAFADENHEAVIAALPDPGCRKRVVGRIVKMLPQPDTGYAVELAVGTETRRRMPSRPSRKRLRLFEGPTTAPPEKPYREETIEAVCRARIADDGKAKILELLSYHPLDLDISWGFRPDEIEWEERRFILQHAMRCRLSLEDGLWVIVYDPLDLRAYASTKEQAEAEFAQEFAMIWDEYGRAEDGDLSDQALSLKRHISEIVREVAPS